MSACRRERDAPWCKRYLCVSTLDRQAIQYRVRGMDMGIPVWAVRILFVLGWLSALVAVALWGRSSVGVLLLTLIFVGGTAVLLRDLQFPKRRAALTTSWFGPLVVGLVPVVEQGTRVFDPRIELCIWVFLNALMMTWLLRGYGLIPIMAMGSSAGLNRERLTREAEEYPPRWWILGPLLPILLGGAVLLSNFR